VIRLKSVFAISNIINASYNCFKIEDVIVNKCTYRGRVGLELITFLCAKQEMSMFRRRSARRTDWLVALSTIRSREPHDRKDESTTEVAVHYES